MTEKELLEKIKDSAKDEPIPESIKPEKIKEKLRFQSKKAEKANSMAANGRNFFNGSKIAAAALVVLFCGALGAQTWNLHQSEGTGGIGNGSQVAEEAAAGNSISEYDAIRANGGVAVEAEDVGETAAPKQDAGDLYTVAKNYEEIYDLLAQQQMTRWMDDLDYGIAVNEDSATAGSLKQEISAAGDIKYSETNAITEGTQKHYSTTNLQTEGVDESDIIKTDGSYLYAVKGNSVIITDIRDGALEKAGEITLPLESASDRVIEMYVDGKTLSLIVQKENTGLKKENGDSEDFYYMSSEMETEIRTYDISSPQNPKFSGSMAQEGYYHTSRKIGDILYLFTDQAMASPTLEKEFAVIEENVGGWIPLVNGKPVAADCIYLSKEARQGLVISSVNVNKPDTVVDNTVIMNGYVDIYVSPQAAYLYQGTYENGNTTTKIAKFSLEQGRIDAVDAAAVNGEVRDTFAINEYQGKLRILTTSSRFSGGESTNQLYLFDEKLKPTGKIEDIAPGEEIYAARYLGDMAYFVTYRNTDPLFAVDLSDDTDPKIVGELKITGFSEYLHFWGEDKLVGIGYETDPDNGGREGLKITMFDISAPAKLKEIKTIVLKNVNYSQALYDYKSVLADAEENLLGFTVQDYSSGSLNYLLFSWEEGTFECLLTEKLSTNFSIDNFRGIYVDDIFYVAGRDGIRSFDRNNGYALLKQLEF